MEKEVALIKNQDGQFQRIRRGNVNRTNSDFSIKSN